MRSYFGYSDDKDEFPRFDNGYSDPDPSGNPTYYERPKFVRTSTGVSTIPNSPNISSPNNEPVGARMGNEMAEAYRAIREEKKAEGERLHPEKDSSVIVLCEILALCYRSGFPEVKLEEIRRLAKTALSKL